MDRSLALIQRLQDTYAHQCGISIILMDRNGHMPTRPAWTSSLAERVKESVDRPEEWLRKIMELSILDLYPGLKAIICPIPVREEIQYYLCAGLIIESGSRQLLYQYIEQDSKDRWEWKADLERLPDTTAADKQYLIEQMKLLSDTVIALLESEDHEERCKRSVIGMKRMSESAFDEHGFTEILQQYLIMCQELSFVGFTGRSNGECVISHIVGEPSYQVLIGSRFALGEGFIGMVMATGIEGCWNQVQNDPRKGLFTITNVPPTAIACFPVLHGENVIGVLFGGTVRNKPLLDSLTIDRGRITANLLRYNMDRRQLEGTMHRQLQRMNAVMEISKLVIRTQEVKKIAFMLVDMSLNIVQGKFAAVTLFDPDSSLDEVRIVSRGLTAEQSEQYGKLILREYLGSSRHDPYIRQLENGTTVQECPIYNHFLYGVLSIALEEEDQESQSFIATMAAIGAIAIHQTRQQRNHISRQVKNLHDAIEHWDPDAYIFAQSLRDRTLSFAEFIDMPAIDREGLEYACLLAPYHPDVIRAVFARESDIFQSILDYYVLNRIEQGTVAEERRSYSRNGQILKLVSDSLKTSEWKDISDRDFIYAEQKLAESFQQYMQRNQVIDRQVSTYGPRPHMEGLSKREQEVLGFIVQGLNNKQIATTMYISEHTVKNHITKIFQKTQVNDRAGLMAYFYRQPKKNH